MEKATFFYIKVLLVIIFSVAAVKWRAKQKQRRIEENEGEYDVAVSPPPSQEEYETPVTHPQRYVNQSETSGQDSAHSPRTHSHESGEG